MILRRHLYSIHWYIVIIYFVVEKNMRVCTVIATSSICSLVETPNFRGVALFRPA